MNILLLEDEPLELEQLEFMIHSCYPMFKFVKASKESHALAAAQIALKKQECFDLAFIDIKLPGKSGLEVAAELKEKFPLMELVIVTAYQDFQYAQYSIKLGVMDYLVKPLVEEELVKVLKKFLKKHPEMEHHSELVWQVLNVIKTSYKNQLLLADVAQRLHISTSSLSRHFSEEMGMPFSEYLIHYRVEMAKLFLNINKDWSIQQIADETGFNSQHYFCKAFKRITGKAPKEYRKLNRVGDGFFHEQ
ncbi:DNA-binding response regulator [Candidatus Formimonas warabiya]|uniref:Stage 0 sporulation protein A homolog n=1 Tax=Formimonas warabiya TaxID=1761012 RepID=A0A3G1L0S1_FORW1|nr:DNA-binding response regulator [Candidatus Formimonas warabiya]ATW28085.1 DNA-binding response regulator [Candidatus Formimonas warabiya]